MGSKEFARRRPILSYYLWTFGISWGGVGLAALALLHQSGGALSDFDGLILFPVIVLGPLLSGLLHIRVVDGPAGWENLKSQFRRRAGGWLWFAAAGFLVPLILLVLLEILERAVSPVYAPHFWVLGFSFGIPPGLIEEFGWSGFAFPKLAEKYDPRRAALVVGPLWGLWHAPIVDFLGAAYPHGSYWAPFLLAFIALVSATRVLISWVYTNTQSIPSAQIMHISLTGGLVFLGPAAVHPEGEVAWYALAAAVIWVVAIIVMVRFHARLKSPS